MGKHKAPKQAECVKVIIRVRPLNKKEKGNNSSFILDI